MLVSIENNKFTIQEENSKNKILPNKNILEILLDNRLIKDKDRKKFLQDFDIEKIDPYEFSEMEEAVEMISTKINSKSKIGIYGDFDADGLTGTAILFETLKTLGADPKPFICLLYTSPSPRD